MFFNLLVVAGSETTRNSIALGMVALIDHPEQLDALRVDRSLMPSAVEEILRWTTATLYNRRTATRDTDLNGHRIAQGEKVALWWPSANRDESVFDEPFRFDIRRDPNPHLTFGHRTHFCLGANLARMEIRVIVDEVLNRLGGFRAHRAGQADAHQQTCWCQQCSHSAFRGDRQAETETPHRRRSASRPINPTGRFPLNDCRRHILPPQPAADRNRI